jgi:hypothetical protein
VLLLDRLGPDVGVVGRIGDGLSGVRHEEPPVFL